MAEQPDDLVFMAENFSGRARLFPLPNLVLFPHVIQPLHLFEPRYIELLHEALSTDRLITMTLLRPGWELDYEGRPAIAPVGCLGRVLTWQALPQSRYNLLLLGLRRARVLRELPPAQSFREADVELLEDQYPHNPARPALQRQLIAAFEAMLPNIQGADELFNQLSMDNISLGTLTDVVSYALELEPPAKQMLLAETNVDRRATMLLAHLKTPPPAPPLPVAHEFPPSFSTN